MPVSIRIAAHDAEEKVNYPSESLLPDQLLTKIWKSKKVGCEEMLQTSYEPAEDYSPNHNGFVQAVVQAYNDHHNLIIRPDDIWIAILSQLNLYINAHAEELRSFFVHHEGKRELEVTSNGSRYTVDFGAMAQDMSRLLMQNINDPTLHDVIMPDFTTTTSTDRIVCSVMMMSTLECYFRYTMRTKCGIPSVTLLGERSDYESISRRLDTFATLGKEPHLFTRLLRPILTQFIRAFDEPLSLEFWSKICHYQAGSGTHRIGGWISAFCSWGKEGKWMGPSFDLIDAPLTELEKTRIESYESDDRRFHHLPVLMLDGLRYPVVSTADIPDGFCQVDVRLIDNGKEFNCMMIAGS
ncbi:hypothetical protein M408DRAFT_334372, partial [Serendipita vermifera MAFF 305830]